MGDEPAGPNAAEPRATKRSSDVAVDDLLQTHASAAGPYVRARRGAGHAVERKRVEAGPARLPKVKDVEGLTRREGEAGGQVDREAAVERLSLGVIRR